MFPGYDFLSLEVLGFTTFGLGFKESIFFSPKYIYFSIAF